MAKAQPSSVMSNAGKKSWETRRRRAQEAANNPKPKAKRKLKPMEPIVLPKQVPTASVEEMMLKTVVLVLTIRGIGNRRKVDPDDIDITDAATHVEVNKEWLGVTRKLMNAPELKKIQGIGTKAKGYVLSRALPSLIKEGVYLLPREFSDEVNDKLKAFQAEMEPYINELAGKLPQYKKEAKKAQGPQFREDQFPTAAQIRTSFQLNWRYLYVDSAQGLSKVLAEEERRKTEESWKETRETIQQVLRGSFSKLVDHMVDRLSPNEHGEQKSFQVRALDKVHDFLATFGTRNITNDAQMNVLVEKAKALISTGGVEMLRTDQATRDYVLHGFSTIKSLLDPMIVAKPHRRIVLED